MEITNEERADAVREAQELVYEAIEKIEWAVRGTRHEDNCDAYVIAHMKILAGDGHGYLSRDTNLDKVIAWFDDSDDEDDY